MTERISRLVVVGNGMVGQRFVEALRARDTDGRWRVTVLAEERRPAYDRVRLSAVFDGVDADELTVHTPDAGVDLRLGEPATGVDRARRVVTTAAGEYPYDALVLATEWNEFKQLDFERIYKLMRTPVLVDGRNQWDSVRLRELGFTYFGIGQGNHVGIV